MPGDRDRLSYDKNQLYRTVVSQQGRVTVPADFNEAQEIFSEEMREEALDFVSASGTPDDGYAITFPAPSGKPDFLVSAGTMYVGGLRVALPARIRYFEQPDWLDATAPAAPKSEYIYLRLEEREIGAVEDSSLREVALGGVDTTQRTRLLQRIVRAETNATNCADGLAAQITAWNKQGWQFDSGTMRLNSAATLRVDFETGRPPPGPCEPAASGGYLGADNRLIRVRLTAPNKFVWGYDNASFIFRVDLMPDNLTPDKLTLKLQTVPVDTFHFPRVGRTVEVLRSEAKLVNGEYVAYGEGNLMTLTEDYNPDAQTIKLPTALTNDFLIPGGTPRLFLRIWENELNFTPGTAVTLGDTGLQVIIKVPPAGIHTGDFWVFAVRPSTPTTLYPNRYKTNPQPPDGPRIWVCPLAIISWSVDAIGTWTGSPPVADCREKFDNLVSLTKRKAGGGCCTVTVTPEDLASKTLQDIIDKLPEKIPARVCLSPGEYLLNEPIFIRRNDLTIESCPTGASLRSQDPDAAFRFGLVVLEGVSRIRLHGLKFTLPEAPLESALLIGLKAEEMNNLAGKLQLGDRGGPEMRRISVAMGVRTIDCTDVTIDDCHFVFPPKGKLPSLFAVGIFGSGSSVGINVRNNFFERSGDVAPVLINDTDFSVFLGYLQTHSATTTLRGNALDGTMNGALLDHADLRQNRFIGLTAAMLAQGELGFVRIEDNKVEHSYSGFWLLTPHTVGFAEQIFLKDHKDLGKDLQADQFLVDPTLLIASTMARALEWPGTGTFSNPNPKPPFNGVAFPAAPAFPPQVTTPLIERFFRLFTYLALMEQQAFSNPNQFTPEIHVSGNQVLAIAARAFATRMNSGPGLVIWGDEVGKDPKNASVIVNANRIGVDVDVDGVPGVIVQLVQSCTVNGNLILHEPIVKGKRSLLVEAPDSKVGITGNVCNGTLIAPNRPIGSAPAVLQKWDVLNSVLS